MVNKVTLIGNVGTDPHTRVVGDQQTKVASFSLATTERYKDRNGETKDITDWHNIVVWGKLADIVEKWVQKGSQLYVCGKIRTEEYEKDGVKKYATKIIANEIKLLGRKPEGQQQQSSSPQPQRDYGDCQPPQNAYSPPPTQAEAECDLPF